MQINTFSLVHREKVILCGFILTKNQRPESQLTTWPGNVLKNTDICKRTVLNSISHISEQVCCAADWLLGCVKGTVLNLEMLYHSTKLLLQHPGIFVMHSKHVFVLVAKEYQNHVKENATTLFTATLLVDNNPSHPLPHVKIISWWICYLTDFPINGSKPPQSLWGSNSTGEIFVTGNSFSVWNSSETSISSRFPRPRFSSGFFRCSLCIIQKAPKH